MLIGILFIGIMQITFADEIEKETFVTVNEEEFSKPQAKYNYHEITIIGYIEDYHRGQKVDLVLINPDDSEETITTFASKKGDIYTLLHFNSESQIGSYFLILKYNDEEIGFTSFEILKNKWVYWNYGYSK